MSLINTEVKPFKATAYLNGEFIDVTEADLKGQWSIFFFYPADFTFVCPTELGDLADNYEAFKKLGVEIYSVSTDTHFTHKAWHDSSETIGKLQYPMIADPTLQISRNFEVLIEEAGLAERGTFVTNFVLRPITKNGDLREHLSPSCIFAGIRAIDAIPSNSQ